MPVFSHSTHQTSRQIRVCLPSSTAALLRLLQVPLAMQFYFPTSLNLGTEHSDGFHQELLRGLTHKLNNLLAVIQGFSSLVLMNEDLDSGVAENMQHIREAS